MTLSLFVIGSIQPRPKPVPLFVEVPRGHWEYKAFDALVAAKLAGYPDCGYTSMRSRRVLTRYEFAIMTGRARRALADPHTSFAIQPSRRRALNTAVSKLANEFAPEMKQCGF